MKTLISKKNVVAAAVAFIAALGGSAASASVIYEFSNTSLAAYNGSALKTTSGIFATAEFTDVAGGVQVTLTVLENLQSSSYIDNWTFNLKNSGISAITYVDGVKGTPISATDNVINGSNGGLFDLGFSFAGLTPKELDAGSFSTYKLTGINSGLKANSFLAADSTGIFAAVHVTGGSADSYFKALNTDGIATPAATVPEPATVALLGLGLLGFAASRRKVAKSKNA